MILSLSDMSELKKEFCDSCGGRSFIIDPPTDTLKAFVAGFFAAKNLNAVFSETGEHFTVRRNS